MACGVGGYGYIREVCRFGDGVWGVGGVSEGGEGLTAVVCWVGRYVCWWRVASVEAAWTREVGGIGNVLGGVSKGEWLTVVVCCVGLVARWGRGSEYVVMLVLESINSHGGWVVTWGQDGCESLTAGPLSPRGSMPRSCV